MPADPAVELYLIRHALAAERGDAFPDDTKRPLVPRGVQRTKRAAEALNILGVTLDVILTSPLTRARHTADLLAAGLGKTPTVQAIDSLSPGSSQATLLADLARHARRPAIALVGHEPDLGLFAARLLGTKQPIEFKKGAICRIDLDALPVGGPGHLRWFMTARILEHVGR